MNSELTSLGKSVPQKDGIPRVTGKAKYYSDVQLPGMLHTIFLRSPFPQADITLLDVRGAEAIEGVELVLTYKNCPKFFRQDLHYAGEHVAAVIAKDEETAERACKKIAVEYAEKPFVLELEEAIKPGAPKVFEGQSNVHDWELSYYLSDKDPDTGLYRKKEQADFHGFGDVETGFREADVIVEEHGIKCAYTKGPAMNPRGCVVDFDGEKMTVYTHSQGMHHEKTTLAQVLEIPVSSINYVY